MTTQPGRVVLTYRDLRQLPEDRNRYELLEGDLVMTPAPGTVHQIVVGNVQYVLEGHVRRYGLGKVLPAPCDVLLSDITVLEPDLLFISRERLETIHPQAVRGAPDLVIEVISPGTARRDRHVKLRIYARYGVPYYWLFDPKRREAVAYELSGGAYRQVATGRGTEVFAAPPFADLAIPLASIWE